MPDLSADRPPVLPEKPFTEEDVQAVARAFAGDDPDILVGPGHVVAARRALNTLWARDRLLAPSAEHREEPKPKPKPKRTVGNCPMCNEPITGFNGEPLMETWANGYREYLACAYRYEPCGHEQVKDYLCDGWSMGGEPYCGRCGCGMQIEAMAALVLGDARYAQTLGRCRIERGIG